MTDRKQIVKRFWELVNKNEVRGLFSRMAEEFGCSREWIRRVVKEETGLTAKDVWKIRNENIIKDYISGMSVEQIAEKYDVHLNIVYGLTKHLRKSQKRRKGLNKVILERYNKGEDIRQIARELNVSTSYVRYTLEKRGIVLPKILSFLTDEEKQRIVELREQGKTYSEIAKLTGRSWGTIHSVLKEAGLVRPYNKDNEAIAKAAFQMYKDGHAIREISQILGISYKKTRELLKEQGYKPRKLRMPTEKVEVIRKMREQGYTYEKIRRILGVSYTTICKYSKASPPSNSRHQSK